MNTTTNITRGTTPKLRFVLPDSSEWSWSEVDKGRVDITSSNRLWSKDLDDCTIDGNILIATLSEKETLRLKEGDMVEMQVCVKIGNDVMRSKVITSSVNRILNDREV